MSVALQRVIVRMLYDPAFVAQVYGGAALPELDAKSRALLVAVDRRAWGTDPLRRSRTLTALLEEFPVSAALVGVGRLDAFFSSPLFHRAIQSRQSLALAFGGWLSPLAGPLSALETAVAAARREPRGRVVPEGSLARASGVRCVRVPGGTLARHEHVRARLGPRPLEALARPRLELGRLPPLKGDEILLLQRDSRGEVGVSLVGEALADLLDFVATPRPREVVLAEARRLGAEPGEEDELVEGLVADGLIVGGERDGQGGSVSPK